MKNGTVLKKVTVWHQNGMSELALPTGAVRWEIQGDVGTYRSVRFIAVYADGTIAKFVEYGSGHWLRYEATA